MISNLADGSDRLGRLFKQKMDDGCGQSGGTTIEGILALYTRWTKVHAHSLLIVFYFGGTKRLVTSSLMI